MIIKKRIKVIPEHEKFKRNSKCKQCKKKVYALTRNKYSFTTSCPHCRLKQAFKLNKISDEDKRSERAKLLSHEELLVTNFYLKENFLLKSLKRRS